MPPRTVLLLAALVAVAVMSTLTAAAGWMELHAVFRPLAMVLAIAFVLQRELSRTCKALLVAGLAFSLAGDVLLLQPQDLFLAAVGCFLCAHACYLALFRVGVPWFPRLWVLAATLLAGVAMYALLYPGLQTPALALAVAAYTLAIVLMAAQAIGRALLLRDRAAIGVGIGAFFFMVSDSLLAVDRFALRLPLAPLWVLSTYYVAQLMIAFFAGDPSRTPRRD